MKKQVEGTIAMTPEVWEKVNKSLTGAAKSLGMSIEEYSVIAYAIIDGYFQKNNMKMQIFRDNGFETKDFKPKGNA